MNMTGVGVAPELPSEGSLQSSATERTLKRRKVVRSERACEICRVSKKGCRGGRPCRRCIKSGIAGECFFTVPKRRGRKAKEKVLVFNETSETSKQPNPTKDGILMFQPIQHPFLPQFLSPLYYTPFAFQSTQNCNQENTTNLTNSNVDPSPPRCIPPFLLPSPLS
eukprot:TRINITY_DN6346_c0_g2_i1.p1 TRINITY_DN6346_c0_g2~~TRINITY_DN6346_c0_g2_i1.p1  ORF type:complete len:166 (+),score=25.19 TRINITY_DN6346_c0_g2_i1:2-499(+)